MPQTLEELFTQFRDQDTPLTGSDLDKLMLVILPNFVPNKPLVTCRMRNNQDLLHMSREANHCIFTPNGSDKEFMFAAVYSDVERFPLPRFYCMCATGLLAQSDLFDFLTKNDAPFKAVPPAEMGAYLCEGNFLAKYHEYKQRLINESKSSWKN